MSTARIPTSQLLRVCRRPRARVPSAPRAAHRLSSRPIATAADAAAAAAAASPARPSLLRRAAASTARALLLTLLGFTMAAAPAYQAASGLLTPVTDEDSRRMFVPQDAESQAIEDHINAHPFVAGLRADPELSESRPHLKIPAAYRGHNLTGGTLMGPGRVPVPPFVWQDDQGKQLYQVSYLGEDLCGHPGIVHGGFLATMLDEGLARTCFAALPNRVGLTASLSINYRAPTKANSYVVLRATTTKVEGRKAWVEGRIETLPGEGEEPAVLADATGLFIEPKQAAALATFYASR